MLIMKWLDLNDDVNNGNEAVSYAQRINKVDDHEVSFKLQESKSFSNWLSFDQISKSTYSIKKNQLALI